MSTRFVTAAVCGGDATAAKQFGYLSDTIYQINTSVAVAYDDAGHEESIAYPEIAWSFKGAELPKDDFSEKLESYLADCLYLEKPALWVLENPDALFEPEIESVQALSSFWSKGGKSWNADALAGFMDLWTPKIVLGEVQAEPNTAKIAVNGGNQSAASCLLFGNNYVRLRDIGERIGFETICDSAAKAVIINA